MFRQVSGQFAMIGLRLLEDSVLTINYPAQTVSITLASNPWAT
jgi:hypothetical protein